MRRAELFRQPVRWFLQTAAVYAVVAVAAGVLFLVFAPLFIGG